MIIMSTYVSDYIEPVDGTSKSPGQSLINILQNEACCNILTYISSVNTWASGVTPFSSAGQRARLVFIFVCNPKFMRLTTSQTNQQSLHTTVCSMKHYSKLNIDFKDYPLQA